MALLDENEGDPVADIKRHLRETAQALRENSAPAPKARTRSGDDQRCVCGHFRWCHHEDHGGSFGGCTARHERANGYGTTVCQCRVFTPEVQRRPFQVAASREGTWPRCDECNGELSKIVSDYGTVVIWRCDECHGQGWIRERQAPAETVPDEEEV